MPLVSGGARYAANQEEQRAAVPAKINVAVLAHVDHAGPPSVNQFNTSPKAASFEHGRGEAEDTNA
jgi:hypothetical protein